MMALIWLHVAAMVIGFSALVAHDAVLVVLSRATSSAFIKAALRMVAPAGMLGKALVIVGALSGLYLARLFNYGSLWLVASYVLVALAIILGVTVIEPLHKRLQVAVAKGSSEVEAVRQEALPVAVIVVNSMFWIAVMGLMFFKP